MATYKLSELIDELIKEYQLENLTGTKDILRHKISSVCKKIPSERNKSKSLWDETLRKSGNQKRGVRTFTEYQRQLLISDLEFRRYLMELTSNEDKKEKIQETINDLQAIAERTQIDGKKLNDDEMRIETDKSKQETLKELIGEEDRSYLIDAELPQKKLELMIKALYLMYFEPLDEEQLRRDMEADKALLAIGGRAPTLEGLRAHTRLQDPKHYCKPKQRTTSGAEF